MPEEFSPFPGYEQINKAVPTETDKQQLVDQAKLLNETGQRLAVAGELEKLGQSIAGSNSPEARQVVEQAQQNAAGGLVASEKSSLNLTPAEQQRIQSLRSALKQS